MGAGHTPWKDVDQLSQNISVAKPVVPIVCSKIPFSNLASYRNQLNDLQSFY